MDHLAPIGAQPDQPVSFHQNAARADWVGSLLSIALLVATLLVMKREGQVVDPRANYLWAVAGPQIMMRWALGARRYEAQRNLIIFVIRFLAIHLESALHHEQGLFLPQTWPGFVCELLLGSRGLAQVWVSCCWQLPLGLQVAATLLSAIGYFLHIPSICGSPSVRELCAAASADKAGAAATAAACAAADGKFQTLADLLDWPFTPFLHGRLADRFPVTDMALCATVLAWSHVAFAVVGSAALVLALRGWQGRAAGREGPASDRRTRSTSGGPRLALPGVAGVTRWEAAMYAFCGLQCLWCILRVACITLFDAQHHQ